MNEEHVALYAEFTALAGAEAEVERLITTYAHEVRAEPGNIAFDVYRRSDTPDRFFVFEIYRDHDAFQAHVSADKGEQFNGLLAPHIAEPESILSFLTPIARR